MNNKKTKQKKISIKKNFLKEALVLHCLWGQVCFLCMYLDSKFFKRENLKKKIKKIQQKKSQEFKKKHI